MTTKLCPCSQLEWKTEHMTLEHHPDCRSQNQESVHTTMRESTIRIQTEEHRSWNGVLTIITQIEQFYRDPQNPELVTDEKVVSRVPIFKPFF